jgi:hypothetical protein
MSGMRYSARADGNQTQIVSELRAAGYQVDIVSREKKLYDLVVSGRMYGTNDVRTVRVELKMPGKRLTAAEREYHEANRYPETLIIAYCSEDVLDWFGKITEVSA